MGTKPPIIIPVENQVRELDPKLLLAMLAAKKGFPVIIGSRLEIDFRIAAFQRGIYLSKSMTGRSVKMFRIMRRLGHEIAVWDEEALVHMQPEAYFTRRLSAQAIRHVSHLFAWGPENAELWRQYPHLPPNIPLHVTGNPRGDLLRPELSAYFEPDARKLRDRYGDYLLINTNFSMINSYVPSFNLLLPGNPPGGTAKLGRGAVGMSREFAEGLNDFKQAVLRDLTDVIPTLEKRFPDVTIIVRPHPTEDPDRYHDLAAVCKRVKVVNEGNVIPWLMAARALVHNSCTTGVEAYLLRVPAATYMATRSEYYDDGYYRLPNRISHRCFDVDTLQETLAKILSGELGPAGGDERKKLLDEYLTAREGPLACERIVDVLEQIADSLAATAGPAVHDHMIGRYRATCRRLVKWVKSFQPGSKYHPAFQRHRYPGTSLDQLRERLLRFQEVLGDRTELRAAQISAFVFRISTV